MGAQGRSGSSVWTRLRSISCVRRTCRTSASSPWPSSKAHFPELEPARADRSTVEYYFTLTPHIIGFVFDCAAEAKRVAYLDCDLFFFGPLAEVWEAVGEAPVAIIPHNFNKGAQHLAKYGTYNVGWVSFARSEQGMRCLQFWMSSCREWCRDVSENGRFADQGYLDRFHEFAPDLAVLQHKGFNMAPWNVDRYDIRFEDGRVMADGDPLIFSISPGSRRALPAIGSTVIGATAPGRHRSCATEFIDLISRISSRRGSLRLRSCRQNRKA